MMIDGIELPSETINWFNEEYRVKQALLLVKKYKLPKSSASTIYGCTERNFYRLKKKYNLGKIKQTEMLDK